MLPAERFMRVAIDACREGIDQGQSPFGAVIVRGDQIIAVAHNRVWADTDSTAHAEIVCIRRACHAVGKIDLAGCVIYSTTEPCPMCFSACHWANLDGIVYGASIADAATAGFRELTISDRQMKDLGGSRIQIAVGCLSKECAALFAEWAKHPLRRGTY
jgi:tRNA(Arg) A34 adenosine deaminase TadA